MPDGKQKTEERLLGFGPGWLVAGGPLGASRILYVMFFLRHVSLISAVLVEPTEDVRDLGHQVARSIRDTVPGVGHAHHCCFYTLDLERPVELLCL